jgi:hypothetical protein
VGRVRTFSWLGNALGAGVVNALLNAAFGWFFLPAGKTLPLLGVPGVFGDTLGMAYGISFGTVLVVTPQIQRDFRRGRLLPPPVSPYWQASLERWPRSIFRRSVQLGVFSILVFAPLPLLGLWALSPDGFGREAFALYKGAFAFVEGALVTPFIAVAAMLDLSSRSP